MASKVTNIIISKALKSTYYSIIADCTPDVSHKEQLSLTIRIVNISEYPIKINEHFLGFFNVNDTTGLGLTEIIIGALNDFGLNISFCQGQGYDNGANIKRLFTLFSASTSRWNVLPSHTTNFTLKRLCETRWEAKIESLKAIRYQISNVHDALITIYETETKTPDIAHEAQTLAKHLKDYSFLVSLIAWYNVLFQINVVSKAMQAKDMDLVQCAEMLKKCITFLENYRTFGFKQATVDAKELAEELNIDAIFKPLKRVRRVKCHYDENAFDEPIQNPEKKLEVTFFNPLLDTCLSLINERFEQLNEYVNIWSFLFNLDNLPIKNEHLKLCKQLQEKLTVNTKSEIDGALLCDELISMQFFIKNKLSNVENEINTKEMTPLFVLNLIKKHCLQELYSNTWIVLRILLTIPVTVASGERSFSKLKLIKTYLRNTMLQDRLNSLSMLSIEQDIAENLDFSSLIRDFADKKARKKTKQVSSTFLLNTISMQRKTNKRGGRVLIMLEFNYGRVMFTKILSIDNIITSDIFNNYLKLGILRTDISDHFPIFLKLDNTNSEKTLTAERVIRKRICNEANLNLFKNQHSLLHWNNINFNDNANKNRPKLNKNDI
ncbi:zinc finger MYM-type protein 1-like [Hydra vulgaris]|uniref:zinc finger MYM-type protein 1-like n=1 Tax=Hydra vulgaris TaxID=6087 RepID=UPI0032EA8239